MYHDTAIKKMQVGTGKENEHVMEIMLPYPMGDRGGPDSRLPPIKSEGTDERKSQENYFWIYQPVRVSSSTFSFVGFVIRLTTIMAMIASTNA